VHKLHLLRCHADNREQLAEQQSLPADPAPFSQYELPPAGTRLLSAFATSLSIEKVSMWR
jgi:hypothetical protein